MAGMAGKVNRNGIKKGPKKIHMKRNLQDTSSTFTKGSCLQALLYEEQIVLRPSVKSGSLAELRGPRSLVLSVVAGQLDLQKNLKPSHLALQDAKECKAKLI